MVIKEYHRDLAIDYAMRWAMSRNPSYYDFTEVGGDCTNFVSQCVFAGSAAMNPTPEGWYYYSLNQRSPSWTGVEFFFRFMLQNRNIGPYAVSIPLSQVQPGDVIQLGNETGYYHSLLVMESTRQNILVAAHTQDALWRPLSTYRYQKIRYLHFPAVRTLT